MTRCTGVLCDAEARNSTHVNVLTDGPAFYAAEPNGIHALGGMLEAYLLCRCQCAFYRGCSGRSARQRHCRLRHQRRNQVEPPQGVPGLPPSSFGREPVR